MNMFFCDIRGTITGREDNREEQLSRFVANLSEMCKILQIDELYFDFLSTETMHTVLTHVKEIAPFFNNTVIKMGQQFSEKEFYSNGEVFPTTKTDKISQVRSVIKANTIKRVILADDAHMTHRMIKHMVDVNLPDAEMISLIPNTKVELNNSFCSAQYGIEGLNETMESYINTLKNSNNQGKKM